MLAIAVLAFVAPRHAAADPRSPRVIVTLKPLHALAAGVMRGVGEPTLLVPGAPPAAGYALSDDQKQWIERADVLFWIGPGQERALAKLLRALPRRPRSVPLVTARGVRLMAMPTMPRKRKPERTGSGPDKDPATQPGSTAPPAAAAPPPTTAPPSATRRRRLRKRDVTPRNPDPRIWLDPRNGVAIVRVMARVLAQADPRNASRYRRNAVLMIARIESMDARIAGIMEQLRARRFATVNKGSQYFERQYVLSPSAVVLLRPDQDASKDEVAGMRARLRESGARCLIYPATMPPKLVHIVARGLRARRIAVDAYGSAIDTGPDAYLALIGSVANAYARCFGRRW